MDDAYVVVFGSGAEVWCESLREARIHVYRALHDQAGGGRFPARIVKIEAHAVERALTLEEYPERHGSQA